MTTRTPLEWYELYTRLRAVADDRQEEKGRRQRALAIIETIPRQYRVPPKPSWAADSDGMGLEGII